MITQTKFRLPGKTHQLYQWVLHESAEPWGHKILSMFRGEPESTDSCSMLSPEKCQARKISLTTENPKDQSITFKISTLTRPPQKIENPFKPLDWIFSAIPFSEATLEFWYSTVKSH